MTRLTALLLVGVASLGLGVTCGGCAAASPDDVLRSQADADLECSDATLAEVRNDTNCDPCITAVRATCADRVALYDCEEPAAWPNGPPCTRVALEDASFHVASDLGCPADQVTQTVVSDSLNLGPAGSDTSDAETWTVHASGCGVDALYACADGCSLSAKTSGLSIDGAPVSLTACHAGSPEAFFGVDVTDASSRTLRLSVGVDNRTSAFLVLADGTTISMPASCATAELMPDGSGGVTGTAMVDCSATGHSAVGSIQIVDCT